MGTRITDFVASWAAASPGREAAIDSHRRLTYHDLLAEVDLWSSALLHAGVSRGDRVMCRSKPGVDSWACFLGTASIGAIWVGVTARQTPRELSALATDSAPAVKIDLLDHDAGVVDETWWSKDTVLGSNVLNGQLARARRRVEATDPAAMIYTSGTTGVPKGALIPHRALVYCGRIQAGHWYPLPPRQLCDLPMNHIGGLGDICTSTLVAGGTLVFRDRFDPEAAVRLIDREGVTHLYYIPTQLLAMVRSDAWKNADLSSLEWIIWGGASAPRELLVALSATGARLGTSYSLTESVGSITYTDAEDPIGTLTWSIGRVDPNYEVRLATADGADAATGKMGEIWTRGDHVFAGYHCDPEKTAATIDAEGWLHTGDLAVQEPDGSIRLVGRLSDMFKSGGFNVYPREIENVLEQHPAVRIAVVVSAPHPTWGEVGHAFVVAEPGTSPEVLRDFAAQRLANYKIPKRFGLVPELPLLSNGKVDRKALARLARAETVT
ncbi:class I adenylate-forming enzyme family protein [Jiangella muralis]|uniref:class I adenylate-forming enzyme family protein n=1 Tax=Jiangella muralis TaxID=702383 RepID=UPI00069EC41F|nr:AMP-binding protein [Jiangella muralis]